MTTSAVAGAEVELRTVEVQDEFAQVLDCPVDSRVLKGARPDVSEREEVSVDEG